MTLFIQLLALGLYAVDGAHATATPERRAVKSADEIDSPIPGYDIVIPTWEVSATPDGPPVELNGTVQEVHSQLLELNPNYDTDFGLDEPAYSVANYLDRFPANSGHNCFGRWQFVFTDTLWDGIDYLRRIGGQPTLSAGPSTCSRVSCSYRTAIYWCNDARERKTLTSFGSIADGAQWIFTRCIGYAGWPPEYRTSAGQVFHSTNWNVIVRDDNC